MLNLGNLEHKHNLTNVDADKLEVSAGELVPLPGHRRARGAVALTLVCLVTQTTSLAQHFQR